MALSGVRDHRNAVLGGRRARAMMRAIRRRPDPHSNGHLSGTRTDSPRTAVVDWAFYRDGKRQDDVTSYSEAVRRARDGGGFVWIGLFEPTGDQLAGIAEEFDLHALAVEDAVTAHQRPKLERYGDSLFAVFKTVRYCPHEEFTASSEVVETGELMAFVGPEFVVTVRHGDHSELGRVRRQLQDNPDHLRHGPSAVLHAVADRVVDDYLTVVDRLQDDIDELEISIFSARGARNVERVYQLKREVLELKRAVAPLAGPLRQLAERPVRLVAPEIREYFRDVEDHLARVREQVSAFDELLTSILQAGLAQLTVAENEDMRKISAWVAILAVPTMIAGIYGMNFEFIPETHWRYGYYMVMTLIVGICFGLHRYFKRNGWL
ncbi:magnesium and cobalt transport protein CorA [Actinopolymorpha singaporensis]|uniref:Magnesium transporter n=1 Tax=Actinopolymorpha singaporensis TaxID=117157 RepID=A0A1H1YTZ3_9ACTN|nr:magnesium and cobalt transport protein CorA [Actinopolymorpha singaporensis]SDT24496.1 magnesium transporter [Actinopolymorpha singaporensis]